VTSHENENDRAVSASPDDLRTELDNERRQSRLIAAFFEDAARAAADDRSVFQILAERVADAVGDGCLVSLTSEDGEWLELAGIHASDPIKVEQTRAATARRRLDGTIYADVVRTGRPLFLASLDHDHLDEVAGQFNEDQLALIKRVGANAVMVIPLILGGQVAGVLVSSRTESTVPYTPSDLEVLEALAARATVVLDNAKTHRQLRAASLRLETIITESPIATAVLDADHRVWMWGNASADLFGWTETEVIGQPLPPAAPDLEAEAQELRGRIMDGQTVRGHETRIRRKDGQEIPVSVYAAPLREADVWTGSVFRWVDLSERRRLEAQLQQAQRLESVGRLAGGIAHDFNNILTAIIGFATLMRQELPDSDPHLANVMAIEDAAERATSLVRQLLAFGRQQVLRQEILDLGDLSRDLAPMLQRLIGEDVVVSVSRSAEPWPVEGDQTQLEQVIVNLAVNARDAMPTGGRLTIETRNVDLDAQYAETHPEVTPGPHVMLAVTDTGTGIEPGTIAHIFEPFFTTKEAGRGTGLGLSTVYGIVRQSGGHIWVYSEPGRGATFRLYFPRAARSVETRTDPAPSAKPVTGDETILVAEDEESLRTLIEIILKRLGYTVLLASNGDAAMEIARSRPIDLLVTDVVMPGQSGFDLAAALRAINPSTRVLMMSGYTSAALEPHGLVDPDNLLQKPFTPGSLAQAVRKALAK
jgi:two-component system cell cycle sensor histidine kinase/response regulator CckA